MKGSKRILATLNCGVTKDSRIGFGSATRARASSLSGVALASGLKLRQPHSDTADPTPKAGPVFSSQKRHHGASRINGATSWPFIAAASCTVEEVAIAKYNYMLCTERPRALNGLTARALRTPDGLAMNHLLYTAASATRPELNTRPHGDDSGRRQCLRRGPGSCGTICSEVAGPLAEAGPDGDRVPPLFGVVLGACACVVPWVLPTGDAPFRRFRRALPLVVLLHRPRCDSGRWCCRPAR